MKNVPVTAIVLMLFCLCCCVVTVHAATPATLYATSTTNMTTPSETTVGIYLKNSFQPAIGSLTYALKYDDTALAVKKIDVREGGVSPLSFSSPIIIAFATTSGIPTGDTWLANITFVSKTTAGSITNLVIEPSVIDDVSLPPVDQMKNVTLQNGIITVGPASPSQLAQAPTPQPTFNLPVSETPIQQNTAAPSGQTTTSNPENPAKVIPTTQKSPVPGIGIAVLAGIGAWMIARKNR
ncbi:MAG: hypothetical protein STSR0009_27200 [Methanoregula sp.]